MKSLMFRPPFVPGEVLRLATRRALELGRAVMSDDLLLLALCELDGEQRARQALDGAGVTADALLAEIRTTGDHVADSREGRHVGFSPRMYTLGGLAWGFAAALGDGNVTPEDVLLAILWNPTSAGSSILRRLTIDRESIVSQLSKLGAPIPNSPLPVPREIEWGDRVWFDRDQAPRVLEHLRRKLSPDTDWGFNYEGDRAWVHAESTVDLQALCTEALSDKSSAA